MCCRNCSSSQREHNKIGLAVFGFFCDLIRNLQDPAKTLKGVRSILRVGPWKISNLHRSALGLHKTPWKFLGPRNVALGGLGRRGSPDSGEAGDGDGRGRVGEKPRGHMRPIWGRSLGQVASVRGARRRPAMSAVGARATARGRRGRGYKQVRELQGGLEQGLGECICSEGKRSEKLDGGLQWCTAAEQTGGGETVVWTSLDPLPRWVPGPTTQWAPGTTRLVPHDT
jgi:hypothetical protein